MKRLTDPIDYTPIPKEYVFFREDGKQDNDRPNRFFLICQLIGVLQTKERQLFAFVQYGC